MKLPSMVESLSSSRTYHVKGGSFAICEITDQYGKKNYYQMVFKVYRKVRKYRLHVVSAYPIEERPSPRKVRFSFIARSLKNGKKLPKPQM